MLTLLKDSKRLGLLEVNLQVSGCVVELAGHLWVRTRGVQLKEFWNVVDDRVENHGDDEVSRAVVVPEGLHFSLKNTVFWVKTVKTFNCHHVKPH